jgi:hypothetical protein
MGGFFFHVASLLLSICSLLGNLWITGPAHVSAMRLAMCRGLGVMALCLHYYIGSYMLFRIIPCIAHKPRSAQHIADPCVCRFRPCICKSRCWYRVCLLCSSAFATGWHPQQMSSWSAWRACCKCSGSIGVLTISAHNRQCSPALLLWLDPKHSPTSACM